MNVSVAATPGGKTGAAVFCFALFFLTASLGGQCAKGQIRSGSEIKGLMKRNCAQKAKKNKKNMSSRSQIVKAEDPHLLLY